MTEEVFCFRCSCQGKLLFYCDNYPIVQCHNCGQIFTGIRLQAISRQNFYDNPKYFKRMYGKFRLHPSSLWHRIVAYKRLKLIERFGARGKLLDVGCGYGIFLNTARRYGWSVFGVELSHLAYEYGRNFYSLDIFHGAVEEANYPDHSFDVITAWDVLEHLSDPIIFLKAIRRILKKDGICFFSLPNIESTAARVFKDKWWTLRPAEHIWHFTPRTITQLLNEQGYTILFLAKSPFAGPNFTRIDSMVIGARLTC